MLGAHFKTSANDTTQIDYSKIYQDLDIESEIKSAIVRNDIDLVLKLVESGIKFTPTNLIFACNLGREDLISKLIDADVKSDSDHLDSLIKCQSENLVSKVLESGVKFTSKHLNTAISYMKENIAFKIYESGVQFTSEHLNTAIAHRKDDLAIKIYKSGVEFSPENFLKALFFKRDDLISKLIEAEINFTNEHLKYAIWLKRNDLVEKVLESNITFTAEHLNFALKIEREDLFLKILRAGVDLTTEGLKTALYSGQKGLIFKILDLGAQLTSEHLDIVLESQSEDLALKMLESGIQPSTDSLSYAILHCSDDLITKVAESGIHPSAENLKNAIFRGKEELIFKVLNSQDLFTADHISTLLIFGNPSQALKILEAKPNLLNQIQLDTIVLSMPEFANEIIKNCSKEKIEDLVMNLFAKGHFTEAKNYFKKNNLDNITIDPVDLVTTSIEIDIKGAIEQNKYGAIANLIYRAGIYIPEKYKKYIGNINDDIPENQFEFIHALIHKLAEHYVLFAKKELVKHIEFNTENLKLVDQLFDQASTAQQKYKILKELCELNPKSKHLEKANSPFDAIYLTAGKALEQIDHDFALEVLALNGIVPPKLREPLSGYRGFHYSISDQALEDMFVYGHRAFSAAQNQKNLGYHVRNDWTKAVANGGNLWEFGGTYLSLEPSWSIQFAIGRGGPSETDSGRSIYLELRPKLESPIIFGKNTEQKEIIPAGVKGDEIVAIYELDDDAKIIKIFQNPYIEALPRYNLGDKISYDQKAAENYNRLYKATETYENYEHFLESYVYEAKRLDQFYENRPELPNQVCISPKTLSEIRLDMDVYSHMCVEE